MKIATKDKWKTIPMTNPKSCICDLNSANIFISEIIYIINSARYDAFKSVNKHHIGLNFEIGKQIVISQKKLVRENLL